MKNVPPEKMGALDEIEERLRGSDDPAVHRSVEPLTVEWLGGWERWKAG